MAIDGNFVGVLARELDKKSGSLIEKIYCPDKSEVFLSLKSKDFKGRLMLNIKSGSQRVHFTDIKPINPEKPPMFCMLLRKHFSSAKLINVSSYGFERLVCFDFETRNELGDKTVKKIVTELIGNSSNIILVGEDGKIIDAVKKSDITDESRLVLPGAVYKYPDKQDKLSITENTLEEIEKKIKSFAEYPLSKAILSSIGGISPKLCDALILASKLTDKPVCEIKDFTLLLENINGLKEEIISGGTPVMVLRDNKPYDFSYTKIFGKTGIFDIKEYASFSELLDAFYKERENELIKSRLTNDVNKTVTSLIEKAVKRKELRKKELKECEKREEYRIKGELIKANIGLIKQGQDSVILKNYYSENLEEMEIPLDKTLTAQNNALKYFKTYKKLTVANKMLQNLIKEDEEEADYLNSVLFSIEQCETADSLREIKRELADNGYIKKSKTVKKETAPKDYMEYVSKEGYKILVGKNNVENDYLTTKLAKDNDLWFHTKNIHGSHVIVFCDGKPVSDETLLFAAGLAAYNSKGKNSSSVPVDYTFAKFVKKTAKAKPGMVTYKNQKTLFVTPKERL